MFAHPILSKIFLQNMKRKMNSFHSQNRIEIKHRPYKKNKKNSNDRNPEMVACH